MIYFANIKSQEDPRVLDVFVVSEENCKNDQGEFDEKIGIAYLRTLARNSSSIWVQTYEKGDKRGPFAAPGDTYNFETERFIPSKPLN